MPAYKSILDKVRAKLRTQPLATTYDEAIKWYRTQIRQLGGANKTQLLADAKRAKSWFYPGSMYLFAYDAKLKNTLPYWDKFPLVFPIEFYEDGFLGINLHYLDYKSRMLLFHELLTQVDRHPSDPKARMLLAYKSLKSMARFKAFQPCLKRYLSSHVMSHAIKIDAPDWETALFLPVENFVSRGRSYGKTFVWADSQRIIAGEQSGPMVNGLPKGTKVSSTKGKVANSNGLPTKGT